MISRGVAEYAWADLSWCGMMGKGKVSKGRTAKCSQKQTGSQVNDTVMQNEKAKKTKKKQENQENQEDLLGQSASDIGLFFVFFLFFWFLFAILHAPREGCRELNLVMCLQFCMPQGKDAESWVLSFACFLVNQCICQNRECAKRNAKPPVLLKCSL